MNIKNILDTFDNIDRKDFSEYQISSELNQLVPKKGESISPELHNEIIAFDLAEMNSEKASAWGTHYGPKTQGSNGDGKFYEYPSLGHITQNSIEYWKKRGEEAVNPILKARYHGLVIEFEKLITGENPSHDLYVSYVNDLTDIISGDYTINRNIIFLKLKRALTTSLKINSAELINKCKAIALNLKIDDKYRNDGKFEFCFDNLISQKKTNLSPEEEKYIIDNLEKKLINTTSDTIAKVDPWVGEHCAIRLAKYYKKSGKDAEVKRVLLLIGKAYDTIIPEASGMQVTNWLTALHKLYLSFQLFPEAEELLIKIRANGAKTAKEMGIVPFDFEISASEMKAYVAEILTGNSIEILKKLAHQYIPTKEGAKEQIKETSKVAPTLYIIGHRIQDSKGRTIAQIGSLENDLDGHIIRQISQTLSFSSVFLRQIFTEGINNNSINATSIMDYLKNSPSINSDRMPLIKKGIEAYFDNDYITAIHILIPQIEEAIRNTLELLGGNVLKPSKNSTGFNLRTLEELLRDDILIGLLGDDLPNYFRILLTDPRGWNLRNNVCHGISNINTFNSTNADRLIHVLLCIGLIEKRSAD